MGQISDKLDMEIAKVAALTSAPTLVLVPGTGLISGPAGGPVVGQSIAVTSSLDMQITAIVSCLKSMAAAIKKLEDRK
jgi:hypothetical protein